LYPKLRNGKVSYLADAAAIANTDRRATVRVDLGSKLDAEVPRHTLQAKHLTKAFHNRPQLGFT
jgi:hypothetical protein